MDSGGLDSMTSSTALLAAEPRTVLDSKQWDYLTQYKAWLSSEIAKGTSLHAPHVIVPAQLPWTALDEHNKRTLINRGRSAMQFDPNEEKINQKLITSDQTTRVGHSNSDGAAAVPQTAFGQSIVSDKGGVKVTNSLQNKRGQDEPTLQEYTAQCNKTNDVESAPPIAPIAGSVGEANHNNPLAMQIAEGNSEKRKQEWCEPEESAARFGKRTRISQANCDIDDSVAPLQVGESADWLKSGGSHIWKLDSGEEFNRKPREKRIWSSHNAETSAQKRNSATDSEVRTLKDRMELPASTTNAEGSAISTLNYLRKV
ncbi:hypothetical protein HYPSUDRAFT_203378 [Hypholoma sublateritium FD-334 SS-4]|uniref:Uncharacterized protein n=1 Tax=Hypholoma sublateritium (strain FD-334 SS-4) TaxID=945553 RepID=A0A0D2MC26_HYPSF|nr:hypothetical protein HYPSUDRAFT_203378 [Hypholoma sublateritium FD-334 SS-4]